MTDCNSKHGCDVCVFASHALCVCSEVSKKKSPKHTGPYAKTVNRTGQRNYVQGVIRSVWQVKHVTVALQPPTPTPPIPLSLTPGPQE